MSKFCKVLCILGVISQAGLVFIDSSVLAIEKKSEEGLVANYTFDEGSGETAIDKSGKKNNGKISGKAEYVKLGNGYALKFDGKTNYIDCGTDIGLKIESRGTIECWFNTEAMQGGLITWCFGGGVRLGFGMRSDHKYLLWGVSDGTEGDANRTESGTPALNTWIHYVMTYDGEGICIYKNGNLVNSIAQEITPNLKDVPLKIGRISGYGEEYFKGMIDEVRIYNYALSGQEIMNRYKTTEGNYGNE